MNNNEILIGLRDALDIATTDMVEIFKFGGIDLTPEEVEQMLLKSGEDDLEEEKQSLECDHEKLESFLNGFIIFKRGIKETESGVPEKPVLVIKDSKSVNNIVLKKLKIALSLTGDDMVAIFEEAGLEVTNRQLSPIFRKEGHKHYKKCKDAMLIAFFKGISTLK